MMGHRQVEQAALFQVEQAALFYEFSLEKHVPPDHLLRSIDRFVELDEVRRELAGFYSHLGRPSIDPKLMKRLSARFLGLLRRMHGRRCECFPARGRDPTHACSEGGATK